MKEKIQEIIAKIQNGATLTSSPENWWSPFNPFVVRLDGEKVDDEICDYLFSKKLVKVARTENQTRFLIPSAKGQKIAI